MKIDPLLFFKIIYPFILSFMAVALYESMKKQTDEFQAFLAIFFFISIFVFLNLVGLEKQGITEFFLSLVILVLINGSREKILQYKILFIAFSIGMVVSHYGVSYFFIFIGLIALVIQYLIKNEIDFLLNIKYYFIATISALLWYLFSGAPQIFGQIIHIETHISGVVGKELMSSNSAEGMNYLVVTTSSWLHMIEKGLDYLMIFFIVIGLLLMMFNYIKQKKITKFCSPFLALSVGSFSTLILSIVLPYFSSALNTTRLYQIALIFLAIYSVIGVEFIFTYVFPRVKIIPKSLISNHRVIIGVIFMVFMLFNVGFVYEITKDHPDSMSLSKNWIENGPPQTDRRFFC